MRKSMSYAKHPAHKALYDALVQSLIVDDNDMDKQLDNLSTQKKRRRDDKDQDPSIDLPMRKRESKRILMNAEDNVNVAEMDAIESIKDVVVNAENPTQADASVPKQDMSKWFNTVVVERPESPDPE
ncbi:hypothetical protein Tco_0727540 [Tanacetum coccineum]|uniref:Uncharacterized protein n=1 Tax=Tanacetum coccineum TaxID=301880 RepID=A0ABQ4YIM5_9ASTR